VERLFHAETFKIVHGQPLRINERCEKANGRAKAAPRILTIIAA
jgi:hypothetical protein